MDRGSVVRDRDILFLVSSLDIGGSERKALRLANALVGRGHRVVLAYLSGPATLLPEVNPAIHALDLERTGKFSLGALTRLNAAIGQHGIGTVVSMNLYATLYAGLLARFSPRLDDVKFVASINTSTFTQAKAPRRMLLYRPCLESMDLLIFGAEYQRDLWLQNHLGARAPRSCVLYNGVDAAHFSRDKVAAWRAPGWPADRVVVGAVGRLSPEKSHAHLIRAIAQLHQRGLDVGAVLVGDGPQESELRRLIGELGIEKRAHFCGAVRDVRPYLAGFDIFALTSTAVETFSNAALEALAMGCPVISSRIGGMPEMLASGGGVTYEAGHGDELVEALQALAISQERRQTMAEQARNVVLERFSLQAMVDSFQALI